MEPKFTEQDSLKLITEMIAQTRNNIQKGAGNTIIFWGYSIAIIAILNIILLFTISNPPCSFWIWTLTIPLTVINSISERKKDKKAIVHTHLDNIINKSWQGFLIAVVITLATIFLSVCITKVWTPAILITPSLLIITGLTQYITGIVSRFNPFVKGGYAFFAGALLSILALFILPHQAVQQAILAISMIFGFIIPGHILNRKANEDV